MDFIAIQTRAHLEQNSSIQMVGFYKNPKGDNIFRRRSNSSHSRENGSSNSSSSSEVPGLQRRIKELEDEVKVC